jgi:hypothetical protein
VPSDGLHLESLFGKVPIPYLPLFSKKIEKNLMSALSLAAAWERWPNWLKNRYGYLKKTFLRLFL